MKKSRKPHFRVAIFGSARIKRNDPTYKLIYELAGHIAAEGMDVVTGGGPGVMDAANKGHQEGRGKNHNHLHSFGLNIRLPKWEQVANRHLDIKKEFYRFSKRLDKFMELSNVVVVAPGGIGTLLELFYTWQLIQVERIRNLPVILLGDLWQELIEWIEKWPLKRRYLDRSDLQALFLAKNCEEAMTVIRKAHAAYACGKKDFCLKAKKVRIKAK